MGLGTQVYTIWLEEGGGGASFVLLKVMGPPGRIFAPQTHTHT